MWWGHSLAQRHTQSPSISAMKCSLSFCHTHNLPGGLESWQKQPVRSLCPHPSISNKIPSLDLVLRLLFAEWDWWTAYTVLVPIFWNHHDVTSAGLWIQKPSSKQRTPRQPTCTPFERYYYHMKHSNRGVVDKYYIKSKWKERRATQ